MKFEHLINIGYFIWFLSIVVHLFWKQKKMGQVVFRLPMSRFYRLLFPWAGVVYITIPFSQIILARILGGSNAPSLAIILTCLTCAVISMSPVNRRFEILENGINVYGNFTTWDRLTGFQWKAEGDYKIGLGKEAYILGVHKPGDKFPWWLEEHKFQPTHHEKAKKVLSQYLPEVA